MCVCERERRLTFCFHWSIQGYERKQRKNEGKVGGNKEKARENYKVSSRQIEKEEEKNDSIVVCLQGNEGVWQGRKNKGKMTKQRGVH